MKSSVKTKVKSASVLAQNEHLSILLKQGEYIKFMQQKQFDPSWKSFI